MVLQRNSEVNLWGSATPNRTVTVRTSWNGKKYKTKSDKDGKWALKVATGEAGGPYEIEFSDGDKLTLGGILLGEVWVCGGQSNMEMPIKGFVAQPVQGAAEAIKIENGSLTPTYIQYLWVRQQNTSANKVIYIPTEAGLPILEAKSE